MEDLARSLNAISPPAAALNNQQQQHPPVTCPIEQAPTLGGPLTVAANQTGGQLMLATGCLLSSALIEVSLLSFIRALIQSAHFC